MAKECGFSDFNFFEPFEDGHTKWELEQDNNHVKRLMELCVKGCTGEHMPESEAKAFYDDFVKDKILYHYPEDSMTLTLIIDTYNFLNKWK